MPFIRGALIEAAVEEIVTPRIEMTLFYVKKGSVIRPKTERCPKRGLYICLTLPPHELILGIPAVLVRYGPIPETPIHRVH